MIYSITLNPALDRTIRVKKIQFDETNRIIHEHTYAGGKGIDVSRVLTNLGINNKALGFIGGFAGEELAGLLLNDGIKCDFTKIYFETRTNIVVDEDETERQVLFSARGPEVRPYELMQLIHKVEALDNPEVVIISGSLPQGVHPEVYGKIIEIAKNKGAITVLDADGDALLVGIREQPDVIKPNLHELSRLVNRELKSMEEIIGAAQDIHKKKVKNVLVSMGARGILLVGEREKYLAVPPEVKIKNSIGAGDSSVAGFVYGLVEGKDKKESLRYAVAAGTATTLKEGTALCRKEDALALLPQITVKDLS